jgi:hypothetical protein
MTSTLAISILKKFREKSEANYKYWKTVTITTFLTLFILLLITITLYQFGYVAISAWSKIGVLILFGGCIISIINTINSSNDMKEVDHFYLEVETYIEAKNGNKTKD